MTENRVAVVMGSDSDLPLAEKATDVLKAFGIAYEARVLSAHRSPEAVWEFAVSAEGSGFAVIISIAGGAAALSGVIASATRLPVIAVPAPTGMAGGLDSLLSSVQMPSGVPVLSTGTNSGGPANAAYAAARILALSDAGLAEALKRHRAEMAGKVADKDAAVREKLA
jgi:5-(carboxyamino)imidazole ribonucleotide mutase